MAAGPLLAAGFALVASAVVLFYIALGGSAPSSDRAVPVRPHDAPTDDDPADEAVARRVTPRLVSRDLVVLPADAGAPPPASAAPWAIVDVFPAPDGVSLGASIEALLAARPGLRPVEGVDGRVVNVIEEPSALDGIRSVVYFTGPTVRRVQFTLDATFDGQTDFDRLVDGAGRRLGRPETDDTEGRRRVRWRGPDWRADLSVDLETGTLRWGFDAVRPRSVPDAD